MCAGYSLDGIVTLAYRNATNHIAWSTCVSIAQVFRHQIAAQTETHRDDFRCWKFALQTGYHFGIVLGVTYRDGERVNEYVVLYAMSFIRMPANIVCHSHWCQQQQQQELIPPINNHLPYVKMRLAVTGTLDSAPI